MQNKTYHFRLFLLILGTVLMAFTTAAAPNSVFDWVTVVNNNDKIPPLYERNFNSYNQPSVNLYGLVVLRARSKGGSGAATHGIYTRDMSVDDRPIIRVLDRTTEIPQPNNLKATFVETPSFPRIDISSGTIGTRGNHQPVWTYVQDGETEETKVGTTGIYTNPFGQLITGAAKLGMVQEFEFFQVPELAGTTFEVFPGAPSVTEGKTIVFKGNYTAPDASAKTGVYFRNLYNTQAGGISPAVMIANSLDTMIPGSDTIFGSTSPPSAAGQKVVFAGFDNENQPTLGGIYLAPLQPKPQLTTLVNIGERVPGESREKKFTGIGEGGAFDGRHVGFWGAWGKETKTVRLYCATEGNKDRIDYCNKALICKGSDNMVRLGDEKSICDDESDPQFGSSCYQEKEVPVNQGIFVHDIKTRKTQVVAKTDQSFDDFLYWNYSGKTPCAGNGHSSDGAEEDGEPVRWRSSAFVAVSGKGATFKSVFKAKKGDLVGGAYVDLVDGIYLKSGPGKFDTVTVLDTITHGQLLDSDAHELSRIKEIGLEREGLRGNWLAISAKMGIEGGEEDDDMAGVYLTELPKFYDLSINEESGFQVPKNYENGREREFVVNVSNLGPDIANGIVTVLAKNGKELRSWKFNIDDLSVGQTAFFSQLFTIETSSDTIYWSAKVVAETLKSDLKTDNNQVRTVSHIKANNDRPYYYRPYYYN
jgi:hypothetical protein